MSHYALNIWNLMLKTNRSWFHLNCIRCTFICCILWFSFPTFIQSVVIFFFSLFVLMLFDSGGTGSVGYRWPRRLRQASTSQLSRYKCHSNVLFCRFTGFAGKYTREMDTRSKWSTNRMKKIWFETTKYLLILSFYSVKFFRLNISVQMFQSF